METDTGAEFISQAHARHVLRYVQAKYMLSLDDKIILDAACGTGYGTAILADDKRKTVCGIDLDDEALREALKNHAGKCTFVKHDLLKPINRMQVDAIVSIETIEHFSEEDGEMVLANFNGVMSKGGTLIISTPYCLMSGPSPITKQHLWEYSLTDFEHVLTLAGFAVEFIKTERHEGKAGRLGYAMAKAIKR